MLALFLLFFSRNYELVLQNIYFFSLRLWSTLYSDVCVRFRTELFVSYCLMKVALYTPLRVYFRTRMQVSGFSVKLTSQVSFIYSISTIGKQLIMACASCNFSCHTPLLLT